MRLRAITIPPVPGRESGYDDAPAAFARHGLYDALRTADLEVVGPDAVLPAAVAPPSDDAVTNIARLGANVANSVATGLTHDGNVVITGGNCTGLVGILAGFEQAFGPATRIGLVWFDAHGDFNTPKTTITGSLGGMPVAVAAGLAFPRWREIAGLVAPIPTNRIVMADVRNLDPKERTLIEATDIGVAAIEPGREGLPLAEAVEQLAAACDVVYLHVDEDVLDECFVPNHGTREPNGPDVAATLRAIRLVLQTGKVRGYGLVSVNARGDGARESVAAGIALLTDGLRTWAQTREDER
jgi:arginase